MNAPMFKVVESKGYSVVLSNKSFGEAYKAAQNHNSDPHKVSEYKVMAQ